MKPRLPVLALAALLAGSGAARAQFEGVADFKITTNTSKGESMPGLGKIYVAPGAYRMELETDVSAVSRGKASHAADAPQKIKMTLFGKASDPDHLTMIDDAGKTYSVWDLKKVRQDSGDLPKQTFEVKKLGTDTVAGVSCQKAELISSTGTSFEVCVAKEFPVSSDWLAAVGRRQREGTSWLAALRENGLVGFPVRFVVRKKGSTDPLTTMVMTRLEKGPVSAALFEVPAGYRETDFAMGGLSPEQRKAVEDARARMKERIEKMTPEERQRYEDAKKRYAKPTPNP